MKKEKKVALKLRKQSESKKNFKKGEANVKGKET